MSEITLSLLTPISIRLSWSGSGDFEVWWKSDHPAGQEYAPLATVTGTSYDVAALSWTTTYYFKVRQVGGSFGNEINVFVCCGQAVILSGGPPGGGPPGGGPPGPPTVLKIEYWQQTSFPGEDGSVTFAAKDIPHENVYLWNVVDGIFYYQGVATYTGSYFPVALRRIGNKVFILDLITYGTQSFGYMFSRIDIIDVSPVVSTELLDMAGNIPPVYEDRDPPIYDREYSEKSLPYNITVNNNGRVVIVASYIDWTSYNYDDPNYMTDVFSYKVSLDWGNNWGDEVIISRGLSTFYTQSVGIAETSVGSLWAVKAAFVNDVYPWWAEPDVMAEYRIYKDWTLVRTISTTLKDTYSVPPSHAQTGWSLSVRNANIATEGETIVIAYVGDFTHTIPVGNPDFCGMANVYVDISLNNGGSWATHLVGSYMFDTTWAELIPTICISSGNLIVYLISGTGRYTSKVPLIIRSIDNGVNWSTVYTFTVFDSEYPWVFKVDALEDHVTATGCGAALSVGGSLAYWESLDAGATWNSIEAVPEDQATILVPA